MLILWPYSLLQVCFWSQIGFRPFVEACIDADEKGEALKYIPKLADPRERAEVRPKRVTDVMHVLFPAEVLVIIARVYFVSDFL